MTLSTRFSPCYSIRYPPTYDRNSALGTILEPTKEEVLTMCGCLDRAGTSLPTFDTALEEPYGTP